MNRFSRALISYCVLLYVNDAIAGGNDANARIISLKKGAKAPFAVIRTGDSELVAALPQQMADDVTFAKYHMTNENDFFVACPDLRYGNALHPPQWFDGERSEYEEECEYELIPSVITLHDESLEEIGLSAVGVGYWVWNEKTVRTDFVTIYQSVISDETTLYTTHTIESLNFLKTNSNASKKLPKNQYQLVPYYHMPIHSWQTTTTFFGYNIVSLSQEAIAHLQLVDDYVKTAIIETNSRVRIHSGKMIVPEGECLVIFRVLQNLADTTGVVFIILIDETKRCYFSCYQLGTEYGWSFMPEPKTAKKKRELETFICRAEDGLYSFLKLRQFEHFQTMDVLAGPLSNTTKLSKINDHTSEYSDPLPTYMVINEPPHSRLLSFGERLRNYSCFNFGTDYDDGGTSASIRG